MGKLAFVCSGQGSQLVGMGVDFVGRSSWGADFFEEVKAISGLDIFDLCTNGPAEELDQVQNQLPCLIAADLAVARALGERGLQPDCVAGFGIGEYAAHVIAGTADLECLLTLGARVGALAAMAGHTTPSASALLKGCTPEAARGLCERHGASSLYVSAELSPSSVVLAGREQALEAALAEHLAAGKAGQRLNCAAALGTPLAQPVASGMAMALKHTLFGPGELPLYCNLTGELFDHMRSPELLGGALTAPVQWAKTVQGMLDAGVDRIVQCGPGGLLLEAAQELAAQRGIELSVARAATVQDVACILV
ncbi:MAG: ACP S-malonyltransferase [Coriobacteriales bacterium]